MKLKKITQSLTALGLTAISVVSAFACSKKESETTATVDDVEFWATYATESVWRDVGEYEDVKFPAQVTVEAIGGEVESAQLIMTTGEKSVPAYEVSISDLYCGEEKFDKANVTIYHEKYINVAATEYYDYNGDCPDCLVPFENVKELGENTIAANNNQGLYVSFTVPEAQASGTYTGTLTVTIGGTQKQMPVSLTVADASIGIENHTKSCFSLLWGHGRSELDTTQDMMNKYINFLGEYRLGANHLLYRSNATDAEVQLWAETACELVQDPKTVSYSVANYDTVNIKEFDITYSNGKTLHIEKDEAFAVYDGEKLIKYFLAFFYEGLEQNVDPFKKAFFKGVDEPFMWYQDDFIVVLDSYIFRQAKEKAIATVRADESIENQELLSEMIESLYAVPHVVTDKTVPKLFDPEAEEPSGFDPEVMDLAMCPYFSTLNTQSNLDAFRLFEGNELWWYGCNVPRQPYPTYHLGDTLISPRICSWMQADYGVIGNLYWAAEYARGKNADGSNWLEDYYEGDGMRSASTYGEGFIMYAGKKYGIDGPLPSLRLEAIRDGLEEYEMIYKLQEIYAEKGYSEDTVMDILYNTMYTGTRIPRSINGEIFANARERLIDLLELAESDANVIVADVKEERDKNVVKVYCNEGYALDLGEATMTSVDMTGGKEYTVSVSIGGGSFGVKTTVSGKEYAVSFDTYANAAFYTAEQLNGETLQDSHTQGASLEKELVVANTVNNSASTDEKYIKLSFGAASVDGIDPETGNTVSGREQRVRIEGDIISKKLTTNSVKAIFEIYSTLEEEISVTLYYKGTKASSLVTPAETVTLKKGMNTLTLNLNEQVWSATGGLQYVQLSFGNKGDAARTGIYLAGLTVYDN